MRNGVCTGARTHFTKTNLGGAREKSRCSLAPVKSCEKSVGTQVSFQQPLSKHLYRLLKMKACLAISHFDLLGSKSTWLAFAMLCRYLERWTCCFLPARMSPKMPFLWGGPNCLFLLLPPWGGVVSKHSYFLWAQMRKWFVQTCLQLCLMRAWNMPANIDFDWFVVCYCKYKW